MTLEVCTEAVRQQDPDRFGAALVAPPKSRPGLITLYALNLEIARAPFQSAEPMLAEMRVQWWVDRLAEMGRGTAPPLHDVLTPLWQEWGPEAGALVGLAEARRRDAERDAFDSVDEVVAYIDATAGGLMWAAARHLGAKAQQVIAAQARGAGIAAWLRALPQLRALGLGLRHDGAAEVQELARIGLLGFAAARRQHRQVARPAAAALYPGPGAGAFLRGVARSGLDQPPVTPFARRGSLAWLALTGRWWI